MGDWYWIGLLAGLGTALGVVLSAGLAATRAGIMAAAVLAAGGGLLMGLVIGEWDEAIGGAIGGLLGAAGSAYLVRGTFRRGGTRSGIVLWVGLAGLAIAGLALVPGVGYLEALALPAVGARLRTRAPKRYAGLRTLAK